MKLKIRRIFAVTTAIFGVVVWLLINPESYETVFVAAENEEAANSVSETREAVNAEVGASASSGEMAGVGASLEAPLAREVLALLEVKGRAPKTGYTREMFYNGWPTVEGCSLRQRILKREFGDTAVLNGCNVVAGEYDEPYTGKHLVFTEKSQVSKVQIDHVVALSDAWQKGAQYMSYEVRNAMATDPLNLLAVDGSANQGKSDGDAATWLPANKGFRCQYVARQVSVKYKYGLWVTEAEKEAISKVLSNCPGEKAVGINLADNN